MSVYGRTRNTYDEFFKRKKKEREGAMSNRTGKGSIRDESRPWQAGNYGVDPQKPAAAPQQPAAQAGPPPVAGEGLGAKEGIAAARAQAQKQFDAPQEGPQPPRKTRQEIEEENQRVHGGQGRIEIKDPLLKNLPPEEQPAAPMQGPQQPKPVEVRNRVQSRVDAGNKAGLSPIVESINGKPQITGWRRNEDVKASVNRWQTPDNIGNSSYAAGFNTVNDAHFNRAQKLANSGVNMVPGGRAQLEREAFLNARADNRSGNVGLGRIAELGGAGVVGAMGPAGPKGTVGQALDNPFENIADLPDRPMQGPKLSNQQQGPQPLAPMQGPQPLAPMQGPPAPRFSEGYVPGTSTAEMRESRIPISRRVDPQLGPGRSVQDFLSDIQDVRRQGELIDQRQSLDQVQNDNLRDDLYPQGPNAASDYYLDEMQRRNDAERALLHPQGPEQAVTEMEREFVQGQTRDRLQNQSQNVDLAQFDRAGPSGLPEIPADTGAAGDAGAQVSMVEGDDNTYTNPYGYAGDGGEGMPGQAPDNTYTNPDGYAGDEYVPYVPPLDNSYTNPGGYAGGEYEYVPAEADNTYTNPDGYAGEDGPAPGESEEEWRKRRMQDEMYRSEVWGSPR